MSDTVEKTVEPTAAEKLAAGVTGEQPVEKVEAPAEKPADKVEEPAGKVEGEPADKVEEPAEKTATDLVKDDGSPFTRADLDGLQNALKASRKEARDAKGELATLKTKGADRPVEEIEADIEAAATAKWKPLMVKAAARAAFAEAGLVLPKDRADEALARAVRLLDTDTLTISDDGLVVGLADQVEALRSDFPDLFAGSAARRPGRIDAGDKAGSGKPPASTAELIAAGLLGQRAS